MTQFPGIKDVVSSADYERWRHVAKLTEQTFVDNGADPLTLSAILAVGIQAGVDLLGPSEMLYKLDALRSLLMAKYNIQANIAEGTSQ